MAKTINRDNRGIAIAAIIVACWFGLLVYLLRFPVDFTSPLPYLFMLLQTHMYTGLFITAHDAMHGVVAPGRPKLNRLIGTVTAFLFAYNWYPRLLPKHHQHHKHVATEEDPDYHHGSFWPWYYSFLKNYITWWQIVLMAITYNVLQLFFPLENVIMFWMVPAILATFQLFYFGTYLPHRGEHAPENKHKSGTQDKNHLWAFVSCYFFGYHYEHHDKPYLPWWQLYKAKG
ncbi:fatty acid desaturase [Pontibacter ramchanderi]|uniref:Beta-carotene ketolase (CrtW type) n=1 Tax=Pontibacter ramchanderi TaxID=1179743 RepID=A0A2N3V3Y5_9BACT|nr:fatty acid desaturase [Pontibacter ramchanderi]PKV76347.1 beta-carotene ketolase (CrtW type) [Pontibacter ramchanderi]